MTDGVASLDRRAQRRRKRSDCFAASPSGAFVTEGILAMSSREREQLVVIVAMAGKRLRQEETSERPCPRSVSPKAATLAMINRLSHGIWSFQHVTSRVVVERLPRDPDAVRLVTDRLGGSLCVSEVASLPRYLSAAGALDEKVHQLSTMLLQQEAREPLPRAGYDAVDDSIRAVSRSLLKVVTPSFSPRSGPRPLMTSSSASGAAGFRNGPLANRDLRGARDAPRSRENRHASPPKCRTKIAVPISNLVRRARHNELKKWRARRDSNSRPPDS